MELELTYQHPNDSDISNSELTKLTVYIVLLAQVINKVQVSDIPESIDAFTLTVKKWPFGYVLPVLVNEYIREDINNHYTDFMGDWSLRRMSLEWNNADDPIYLEFVRVGVAELAGI